MELQDKKIGIWGYGLTGKAAANFVHERGAQVTVLDQKPPYGRDEPWQFVRENNKNRDVFLDSNDLIIPSPGIDIAPYLATHRGKWLSELDLFVRFNQTPTIAITGSLGKTTVTTLLTRLLNAYGVSARACGNIGTPVLNLLPPSPQPDQLVLECSSFQLEHCQQFAPDLAIVTNLVENHLDRHQTMAAYFAAKSKIFAHQRDGQHALVPLELAERARAVTNKPLCFTHGTEPSAQEKKMLRHNDTLYYLGGTLVVGKGKIIADIAQFPSITFAHNWLTICAALDQLGLDLTQLPRLVDGLSAPPHRLERVSFRDGITVYNDSKSTAPAATLAAIDQLNHPQLILFLGGLSKGIDREPLIRNLAGRVRAIYCFGGEAQELHHMCRQRKILSSTHETLEDAWRQYTQRCVRGDCVLFSPAGSSFDLFKNFEKRGNQFKKLVVKSAKVMPPVNVH